MNPQKLNQLRAAVLGANDGIISVAAALVFVLGAFEQRAILLTALAVLLAGAFSMAAGEYVSVSAQVHHEEPENNESSVGTGAPLQAALASFAAFLAGGIIPAALAVFTGMSWLVICGSLLALAISAWFTANKRSRARSTLRLTVVAGLALGASLLGNYILKALGV